MKNTFTFIKRMLKKKWFWAAAIALILIVGGVWMFSGSKSDATVLTDTVKRGALKQTVDATGTLESVDEVELSFEVSGTVETVWREEGDRVDAGELIASLRDRGASADVARAQAAMYAAQGNLNARLAGSTDEAIAIAQAQVDVAKAAASAADVALTSAKGDLEQTSLVQASLVTQAETALTQAQQDLVIVLRGSVIAVRSALSTADETLGVDNTVANNDFQDILAALDADSLSQAKTAYELATLSRDRAENAVFALSISSDPSVTRAAADLARQALDDASTTLLYTRRALDATVADTAAFSNNDLSAMKSSLDAERGSVQSEQDALESQVQLVDHTKKDALALAQAQEASAIASAQAAVNAAEASRASRRADVVSAEASLAQAEATPRSVDVAALRAAVSEAQAHVSAALANLEKTELVAPTSGIVTRMDVKPGEQATAGQTVAIVQSTDSQAFRIVVNVPEADIAKLEIGDPSDITFDAFGDDVHVAGEVQNIDPAQNVTEGVVFYEVTIYLMDGNAKTLGLKPGMSANVTIVTLDLPSVLYVPQRSVLERPDGTKYVRIPEGTTFREVTVTIGARGDEGRVEIASGLSEGDTMITSIRD